MRTAASAMNRVGRRSLRSFNCCTGAYRPSSLRNLPLTASLSRLCEDGCRRQDKARGGSLLLSQGRRGQGGLLPSRSGAIRSLSASASNQMLLDRNAIDATVSGAVRYLSSRDSEQSTSGAIGEPGQEWPPPPGTNSSNSSSSSNNNNNNNDAHNSPGDGVLLPVSAFHVAQMIELRPCLSDLLARGDHLGSGRGGYSYTRHTSHKNSILVEFSPDSEPLRRNPRFLHPSASSSESATTVETASSFDSRNASLSPFPDAFEGGERVESSLSSSSSSLSSLSMSGYPRYVAVYRFGSLVFVNCPPRMVSEIVQLVKTRHSVQPAPTGTERKENYSVLLKQQQPPIEQQQHELQRPVQRDSGSDGDASQTAQHDSLRNVTSQKTTPVPPSVAATTAEYCNLSELDMNGVSVISNVMAQTVALDAYSDMVDDLLSKFGAINAKVTQTGLVPDSERLFLFKTIARNHIICNDVLTKLRIKDRNDTAWNNGRYESVWYGMRSEFEMDDRFDAMEFKLKLIEQNAKFFVEVLQSQKSNTLEWIIVVLIAVECFIMVADMSGLGEAAFGPVVEYLKGTWWWGSPVATAVATAAEAAPAASGRSGAVIP